MPYIADTDSSQGDSDYVPASKSDTDYNEPLITTKRTHSVNKHLGDSFMLSDKIVG